MLYFTAPRPVPDQLYASALNSWVNASSEGNKHSLFSLSQLYLLGLGVKQDHEKAKIYAKLAEKALIEDATLFLNGSLDARHQEFLEEMEEYQSDHSSLWSLLLLVFIVVVFIAYIGSSGSDEKPKRYDD